jgi:flagellar hook-associated protein 3 FlgL
MRISDQIRYGGFVPRYQELVARQIDVQRQISGGIKILRPSDNPGDAAGSNRLNSEIAGVEQNLRNIDQGNAWTGSTEVVLNNAVTAMQRASELATQAGDVTLSPENRNSIALEINGILETIVGLGSQAVNGCYLLSGAQTGQPAFTATRNAQGEITSVAYNGDGASRTIEIAPGRTIDLNLLGSNEAGGDFGIFRDVSSGTDIVASLIKMRDFLKANDSASVTGISLPEVRAGLAHLTLGLARLGGIEARLSDTGIINQDNLDSTRQQLSTISETDLAAAAIEANQLDVAYKAALATGSRVMQTSLLDYLR